MSNTFPALSIQQPWADLIVSGVKDVENRSRWSRFRGYILVHAPQTVQHDSVAALKKALGLKGDEAYQPVKGAIIGVVEVAGALPSHKSKWYSPGSVALVLRNARRFDEPIAYRGARGVFHVPMTALKKANLKGLPPGELSGTALFAGTKKRSTKKKAA